MYDDLHTKLFVFIKFYASNFLFAGFNLMPNPQPEDFMQQIKGKFTWTQINKYKHPVLELCGTPVFLNLFPQSQYMICIFDILKKFHL